MRVKDYQTDIHETRTLKYCASMLKAHGKELMNIILPRIITAGLYDERYLDFYTEDTIGLLVHVKEGETPNFKHPAIVADYYYGELIYGRMHMLVIKIPNKHIKDFNHFKKGEYSKMDSSIYRKSIFLRIFEKEIWIGDIINKNENLKNLIEEKVGQSIEG